ncbi:MAG TPA: acyl-CoA dehydrogenase family protein [Gemmatimonadaceae bacterium]|nr:acyl-CoA dehydrogenase family protein [Gemmatimonadaceae bacterium]
MSGFYQSPPVLGNQYRDDVLLRSYLRGTAPPAVLAEIEPELLALGGRAAGEWLALAEQAEAEPPRLRSYDPWGARIDRIETSSAWRALERISAVEGLVARGYERDYGAYSRVDQFARLYLFSPSSATYSCPLAMSDGAARCLELLADDERQRAACRHLISRDPAEFWTAGQWMTERTGGSDVSGTSTIAKRDGAQHRLFGTKWFTSATTSQVALTLARLEGAEAGSRGLSLFYLELRDEAGRPRDMRVLRLKEKLGTRALPTAEIELDGTPAWLVGGEGHGVRKIATVLTITRVYNAMASVAGMRRAIALARDYARRRVAFGRPLSEHPLHVDTLAGMQVELAGCFLLAFHVVELLGLTELGVASDADARLLRLLTPVAKLYTGKQAVAVASEAVEAFGGAGYIEDTGLPRLLRDAQVLSIWEGTTNVLSLDVWRAIDADAGVIDELCARVNRHLDAAQSDDLADASSRVRHAARDLVQISRRLANGTPADREAAARRFAFAIARVTAGALLIAHAHRSRMLPVAAQLADAARRWSCRELIPALDTGDAHHAASKRLGLDADWPLVP